MPKINSHPKDQELNKLAQAAKDKKAAFGEDIDLSQYAMTSRPQEYVKDIATLPSRQKERLLESGIDPTGENRSGTYLQVDHSVVHCSVKQEGLELMSVADAREKYDWMDEYWWMAVKVDADKYTATAALQPHFGYFIRAKAGMESVFPLQACLYLGKDMTSQNVHNIIIAEEGAKLHIITGCQVAKDVKSGIHLGVSEFYVKKNATITFTMIHNWAEEVAVRPRTGAIVEEGGVFLSNYVCMKPVRTLQAYPTCYLNGRGATARFNSILVATPGSHLDVGARVILAAPDTRAEIISRTITTGGTIIARGQLIGEAAPVKAHLECHGLQLADTGVIHAIPELLAKVSGVEMSHEAAVGKIAQEEIEYLMCRGLSKEEATATIVRGFLNVQIEGLPLALKQDIDSIVSKLEADAL